MKDGPDIQSKILRKTHKCLLFGYFITWIRCYLYTGNDVIYLYFIFWTSEPFLGWKLSLSKLMNGYNVEIIEEK